MTETHSARSHGAVTILNATATGRGCSLGVVGGVEADWTWTHDDTWTWKTLDMDDRLAHAVHEVVVADQGVEPGATVKTRSETPASRGLKTSSGAATALVRAAAPDLVDEAVERLAVAAARTAGVTLTGAFDDQVAVTRGGCHLTDNAAMDILAVFPPPDLHVAVWVSGERIPKDAAAAVDTAPIVPLIEAAETLLRGGDIGGAMTANGAAFTRLYRAAGLPVTERPAQAALDAGAIGAGLSGTGPAVAALFDAPVDLPDVPGGIWHWTRTVAP